MNILVTGGAGFIGSHTVDALLKQGHKVRILDSLEKPVHLKGKPDYLAKDADFVLGSVQDKKELEKALEDIDAIYHFAAYQDYNIDFSKYFSVNCAGTALIYEIVVEKKLPIKKIIVASSQSVLGEGRYVCRSCGETEQNSRNAGSIYPDIRLEGQLKKGEWDFRCPKCQEKLEPVPSDEIVINPQNQYGISKYSQELISINLGKRYSIPTVCLRYSIVQGARQSFYNTYSGALRNFCLHLFFDKSPTIYEDGSQIRDYVNIQDAVDASLLVYKKEEANYQVFNIGGGKTYTVNEFYKKAIEVFGKDIKPRISGEYRYGDTRHIISDISKIKKLGWEPRVSIEKSIREYKKYLEEQVDIEDILEYQTQKMRDLNIIRKANLK